MSSLDRAIDASVKCLKCGAPGFPPTCDCWERCTCGWWAEKGKPCNNPKTTRRSSMAASGGVDSQTDRQSAIPLRITLDRLRIIA